MDLYNLVTKIPYLIMLGIGITLILQMFLGGLQDLSADIDTVSEDRYRSVIVLERLLNLRDGTSSNDDPLLAPFEYDERRGYMPKAYFTSSDSGKIGGEVVTEINGDEVCKMNGLKGLDGEEFAYQVGIKGVDETIWGERSEDILCSTKTPAEPNNANSPVLLIGEDNPMEAIIYVFPIEN